MPNTNTAKRRLHYQANIILKWFALLVFAAAQFGCANSYTLRMQHSLTPKDSSVVSPRITQKMYRRIIVIPPSGRSLEQFDPVINYFEREFMKNGITVISSAITGRVVFESGEKRVEGATPLSEAERALIMAQKTGADAILQIGRWQWSESDKKTRYFILDEDDSESYEEVSLPKYRSWEGKKYHFYSPVLYFIGRVTDVESGEVIASLKISSPLNWNLPENYTAVIKFEKKKPVIIEESFEYDDPAWHEDAREEAEAKVVRQIVKRLSQT